jgi:hypothetical protein
MSFLLAYPAPTSWPMYFSMSCASSELVTISSTSNWPAPGSGGGTRGNGPQLLHAEQLHEHFLLDGLGRAIPLIPVKGLDAAEPAAHVQLRDLEEELGLRDRHEGVSNLLEALDCVVERRIRRGLHEGKDDPLVLGWREFFLRAFVERWREAADRDRGDGNDPPAPQRNAQNTLVSDAKAIEKMVDQPREPSLARRQRNHPRAHDGRQGYGHDPGDHDCRGKA